MIMLRIAGLSDVIVVSDINPEHLRKMSIMALFQEVGEGAFSVARIRKRNNDDAFR